MNMFITLGKRRCGRPSYQETYTDLVPTTKCYIQQNSAEAHLRRRDDVLYTNGVSLKDIQSHVRQSLGLSISKDTVHRLLKPRRQGTRASKYFKSLIDARVTPKRNSGEKKVHKDFHYTCSQVNLVSEMATYAQEGTLCMSVDNKNKVEVGIPAVSRRRQIRKFYLESEGPNYNDHDFPHRKCKLTPAGYQVLKTQPKRSRSLSPRRKRLPTSRRLSETAIEIIKRRNIETTQDKLGRDKIKWPRSGPLTVQIYPSRLIESTNLMHMNYFSTYLRRNKWQQIYNVVAIADGGPDWSVKSVLNLMSMGYLWKNLELDVLVIQCYAPGHSRFNPIERSWSALTKWLVGVILPVEVDGAVPKENETDKWLEALDFAASSCAKFWQNKICGGFPVVAQTFLSNNPLVSEIKNTHKTLHEFTNASKTKINESPNFMTLQKDYQFLVKHCNRKLYQLEFVRCREDDCSHCLKLPKRNNEFLDLIYKFGGSCPVPEKSLFSPDHFTTFLERLTSIYNHKMEPHKVIKSNEEVEACEYGCSYLFFSEADRKRHYILMNHVHKRKHNGINKIAKRKK